MAALRLLQRLAAVVGRLDLEPLFGEVEAGELDDIPLVVDDQDRGGHLLITLWLHLTASAAKHSMGEPPRPVFIDTPAGFQLNAGELGANRAHQCMGERDHRRHPRPRETALRHRYGYCSRVAHQNAGSLPEACG